MANNTGIQIKTESINGFCGQDNAGSELAWKEKCFPTNRKINLKGTYVINFDGYNPAEKNETGDFIHPPKHNKLANIVPPKPKFHSHSNSHSHQYVDANMNDMIQTRYGSFVGNDEQMIGQASDNNNKEKKQLLSKESFWSKKTSFSDQNQNFLHHRNSYRGENTSIIHQNGKSINLKINNFLNKDIQKNQFRKSLGKLLSKDANYSNKLLSKDNSNKVIKSCRPTIENVNNLLDKINYLTNNLEPNITLDNTEKQSMNSNQNQSTTTLARARCNLAKSPIQSTANRQIESNFKLDALTNMNINNPYTHRRNNTHMDKTTYNKVNHELSNLFTEEQPKNFNNQKQNFFMNFSEINDNKRKGNLEIQKQINQDSVDNQYQTITTIDNKNKMCQLIKSNSKTSTKDTKDNNNDNLISFKDKKDFSIEDQKAKKQICNEILKSLSVRTHKDASMTIPIRFNNQKAEATGRENARKMMKRMNHKRIKSLQHENDTNQLKIDAENNGVYNKTTNNVKNKIDGIYNTTTDNVNKFKEPISHELKEFTDQEIADNYKKKYETPDSEQMHLHQQSNFFCNSNKHRKQNSLKIFNRKVSDSELAQKIFDAHYGNKKKTTTMVNVASQYIKFPVNNESIANLKEKINHKGNGQLTGESMTNSINVKSIMKKRNSSRTNQFMYPLNTKTKIVSGDIDFAAYKEKYNYKKSTSSYLDKCNMKESNENSYNNQVRPTTPTFLQVSNQTSSRQIKDFFIDRMAKTAQIEKFSDKNLFSDKTGDKGRLLLQNNKTNLKFDIAVNNPYNQSYPLNHRRTKINPVISEEKKNAPDEYINKETSSLNNYFQHNQDQNLMKCIHLARASSLCKCCSSNNCRIAGKKSEGIYNIVPLKVDNKLKISTKIFQGGLKAKKNAKAGYSDVIPYYHKKNPDSKTQRNYNDAKTSKAKGTGEELFNILESWDGGSNRDQNSFEKAFE